MAGTTTCEFCGMSAPRAKEHVFPRWLLAALEAEHEVLPLRHFRSDGTVQSERRHPLTQFQFGHVCAGCNHGFLSQLEGETRRILGGIWAGCASLGPVDIYALALWSLKTSVTLNAASNYRRIVGRRHAVAVRAMSPPPGLYVHIAFRSPAPKISWVQSQQLTLRGSPDRIHAAEGAFKASGFNIVLGLGNLLVRVVYMPVLDFLIGNARAQTPRSTLVWPRRTRAVLRRSHHYASIDEFALDATAYEIKRAV